MRVHKKYFECLFCVLPLQHWACVRSRSPAPQPAHHPPLLSSLPPSSPLGASRSVRPPAAVSPSRRAFTTEMAAKVSRSVLLLSRSSGTVAGSLPALVVSSQRHHQHIRPVSPRTYVCAQGRGKECGGRGPGGQAGGLDRREKKSDSGCLSYGSKAN